MTEFSLPTLFVATNGTLASSGSTQDLTPGQIGVFRPDYSLASAGNIAAAKYFQIVQGRFANEDPQESKKSDKINVNRVSEWYKTVAEPDATNQIVEISDFKVECGEYITLTLRAHSIYLDTIFFNGFTQSVVVKTACCDCGADPCTELDPQATVDALVAKLSSSFTEGANTQLPLTKLFEFSRVGTGASSKLKIVAKPLDKYGNPCELRAFPYEFDRLTFRAFVLSGPDTTQDSYLDDECEPTAKVTIVQRATYIKGSSEEIKQLERRYYSYQTSRFKQLYDKVGYNQAFVSNVVDGTFYDIFYIKFVGTDFAQETNWQDAIVQDNIVMVAFPTGTGGAFETILTAALGAPDDKSGVNITTTTTTTGTTTTTTTTSTLIP